MYYTYLNKKQLDDMTMGVRREGKGGHLPPSPLPGKSKMNKII